MGYYVVGLGGVGVKENEDVRDFLSVLESLDSLKGEAKPDSRNMEKEVSKITGIKLEIYFETLEDMVKFTENLRSIPIWEKINKRVVR